MSEVIATKEFPQYLKPEHIEIIHNTPTREEVEAEYENEEFKVITIITNFDFYYRYSDDLNCYRRGVTREKTIKEFINNSSLSEEKKEFYIRSLSDSDTFKLVNNQYKNSKSQQRYKSLYSDIFEIKAYNLGLTDDDWNKRKLVAALTKQLFLALPKVFKGHYVYSDKGPGMLFIRNNFNKYPGMAISDKAQDLVDQISDIISDLKFIGKLSLLDKGEFEITVNTYTNEDNLVEYWLRVTFGEESKCICFLFK